MVGVEVVDRHPVELRSEILLHPRHQSPGERFQILIVRAVLRADDEAELVAVVLRPFEPFGTIDRIAVGAIELAAPTLARSEEHTSELQSLMRISYAVFCLKKKTQSNSNDSDMSIHTRLT